MKEKLELIKNILGADPYSLVIGEIVEETDSRKEKNLDNGLKDYYSLMSGYKILNGGVITIYGQREISNIQFYTEEMPGGSDEWVCIGKIENYPLFISKKDGQVSCLFGNPLDQSYIIESYGDFNNFLYNYYLGKKYIEIGFKFFQSGGITSTVGSKDDDWYIFLERNNLF
ncbi:hypothetical protein [Metabacillus fastidiosus]|uniref:hypothetical protein n=1 Tax=Metabacillus fastidiosus TaxID=1458 RepID=UPI002DB9BB1C|nr:hypothetical protein [Metabacillus fastidiosus]MEC2077202.1 hypothetical protein [Metabacillus fastidiosus]